MGGLALDYYSVRLREYGSDDIRALGWGSRESQELRFKVLSEIAPFENRTVLDFGCGFGDLYTYLCRTGRLPGRYIGCDSNPDMLAEARKRHPGISFVRSPEPADYVLASGAFNLNPGWQKGVWALWDLCRLGMAVNFLSSLAAQYSPDVLYSDPFEVTRYVASFSENFVLRHDYKRNDFCVYAYRESTP